MRRTSLGEFEQLVLLAIMRLGDRAYAPEVSDLLEREGGRGVSRGALYSTLGRLEKKGCVTFSVEAADSSRAGYRKRRFAVTSSGLTALRAAHDTWRRLSYGLEELLNEGPS